jgi:hypothetical protein
MCQRLGTPKTPANPFHAGGRFRGFHGSRICYGLPDCSPPCTDLTGCPASGGFYFQAFNGSVTLAVAGYNYSIDWTPLPTGLSPVGMAARLAARHTSAVRRHCRNHVISRRRRRPTAIPYGLCVTRKRPRLCGARCDAAIARMGRPEWVCHSSNGSTGAVHPRTEAHGTDFGPSA